MKRDNRFLSWSVALFAIAMLASCYKFGKIVAPKEVNPNEAYQGRIVVVNDNNNGPVTTLGIFAVRVPENWDVQVEEGAYEQYAEEGVVIPADANDSENKPAGPGTLTGNMHYSALLSSFYNQSNPKEGYTWVAFITDEKHRAGLQGSGSNSCDSIAFNYKVINDGVAGEYEIDYIVGDEEDNIERFNSVQDALGTRVYCTSTESSILPKNDNGEEAFDHVQADFKTTIKVLEGGTPTVHKPAISVDNENPKAGESVSVKFENLAAGSQVAVYRAFDIVPQKQTFAVEGNARFNEGSYTFNGFEPGVYHVRAFDVLGAPVSGLQEGSFTVAYPEFAKGDYNFIVMSDMELLAPELVNLENVPETASYASYLQSPEVVKAAFDQVIAQKPNALFVTGNLTMAGEKKSHELMAELLKPVAAAGVKVYVIPGSSDINNPNAKTYDGEEESYAENITAEDFASIYGAYGYADALERDPNSLSYAISPVEGLVVFCLDDNRYGENLRAGEEPSDDDELVTDGRITKETLEWMQNVYSKMGATGSIMMMNHLVAEPFNGYATLGSIVNKESADLGSFFGGDDADEGDEGNAEEPYEVSTEDVHLAFAQMGVWAVFCGSLQASDIQNIYVSDRDWPYGSGFYQVATASLRAFNSNYRQVTIDGNELVVSTRPIREATADADFTSLEAYLIAAAPITVAKVCEENWDVIEPIFKENFTFDYDPDTDLFNKNDFMRLPESPEDMASRVNSTIVPPMINLITAFVEGNENFKDSQKLVDDLKAGFDAFFDSLNTFPSIITPMIKEGFANAGLDTDVLAESVAGSLAYNYCVDEENVTNDLFVRLDVQANHPIGVNSPKAEKTTNVLYDLFGRILQQPVKGGVYILNGRKVVK